MQIPFQRTMTGLGVRKSWLEKVGEQPPKTWDDVLRIGKKFQEDDPDGNGKKDTFGIAMQAGDAPSITGGGINLLVYGNGLPHPLVNENGDIVIDQPEVAKAVIEYMKLFTDYKLVSPGDREPHLHGHVSAHRGWACRHVPGRELECRQVGQAASRRRLRRRPLSELHGGAGALVVGSVRGMAVPENAKNKDAAKQFVQVHRLEASPADSRSTIWAASSEAISIQLP